MLSRGSIASYGSAHLAEYFLPVFCRILGVEIGIGITQTANSKGADFLDLCNAFAMVSLLSLDVNILLE